MSAKEASQLIKEAKLFISKSDFLRSFPNGVYKTRAVAIDEEVYGHMKTKSEITRADVEKLLARDGVEAFIKLHRVACAKAVHDGYLYDVVIKYSDASKNDTPW